MRPTKARKKNRVHAKAINGKLVDVSNAEKWAAQICNKLSKSVDSIVEVGRALVSAKKELAHGEWQRLFDERMVPFSQSAAERLMKIATHPLLSQSAHASILPPSWYTLYELTKLPQTELARAIDEGRVTPDMPRNVVKSLMPLSAVAVANNGASSAARPGGRETLSSLIARLKIRPRTAELDAVLALCEALRDPSTFLERFERALATYQAARIESSRPIMYSSSSFAATP